MRIIVFMGGKVFFAKKRRNKSFCLNLGIGGCSCTNFVHLKIRRLLNSSEAKTIECDYFFGGCNKTRGC